MLISGLVCLPSQLHASAELGAEQALIVDCLLPGKVRKLGINRQYLTAKRPTKTSANDCEIRGGDYVQYDRATLASSLGVWQEAASAGDAKAQFFVGELFEKGMGQEPDYPMAVMWYQRAVKQGYQPAMMRLGRLHELGLGLPKDLVKAMNLYREASGLSEDEIAYASVFKTQQAEDQATIAALQADLEEQKRKAKSWQRRSDVLSSDLQRAKANVLNLKEEIKQLKQQIEAASAAKQTELERVLKQRQLELVQETDRSSSIDKQLSDAQQRLHKAEQLISQLQGGDGVQVVLKWPEFQQEGDRFVSRVPAGSVVNIVGAIQGFTQVESVRINQLDYELDTNGLFFKTLDVAREAIELTLDVVDKEGVLTATTIELRPSDDLNVVLRGPGTLVKPKFKFGNYHALVIGNNAYDLAKGWEPLDTAVNDAQAIAKVLTEQYGFNVRLELNATRDTILSALESFRRELTSNDNLLVYYAGHGLVDPENDQGYWVPVDGAADTAVRWVSNASITDQIRAMTARNIMVIADSCYSGSLMRSGIVTLRSGLTAEKKAMRLGEDIQQRTRVALSSGGLQPVIDSIYSSEHSVFAQALLTALSDNDVLLDADSLATQVAHSVAIATKDNVKQVPRFAPLAAGGHEGGEFYFAPAQLVNSF